MKILEHTRVGEGNLRTSCRSGSAMLVFALALTVTSVSQASAQGISSSEPVSPYLTNIDIRTLPKVIPGEGDGVPLLKGLIPPKPAAATGTKVADPLWLSAAGLSGGLTTTPPEFSNPFPNFPGMTRNQTGFRPPDTNGAVGPNHYIQTVNSAFQIFNKAGVSLAGPSNINSLFASLPATDPCRNQNRGDPYVLYDHLADRWLISQLARNMPGPGGAGNPLNFECIAISPGPNPTTPGVWHLYTFNLGFSDDYPKIGVWPDGYYMVSQRGYNGNPVDVTVFDRANMLNGNPATFQTASVAGPPTIIMLPSDLTGQAPAPGTPNFFVRPIDGGLFGGNDRIEIREFHVDWGVPANSTFGVGAAHDPNVTLTPADFESDICDGDDLNNNCVPQPDPGDPNVLQLEVLSVWPMGPLQYRNFGTYETLVFNHSVDVNGAGLTGIRWYELRRSGGPWAIQQQGTFSPPDGLDIHRWMGSIAMDAAGNMALGYSVSNGSTVVGNKVYPGIRYAGRLASDPPGTMPHGEVTLQAGAGRMLGPDDGFEARWGDYSAMRVDPVDGCTFWYTQEWLPAAVVGDQDANGSANWRTRVGAFRFPTCNQVDLSISKIDSPDPVSAGSQLNYTIAVTNNGSANATQVVVTDTLPAEVVFLSSSIPCTGGGSIKTCAIGPLASGASTSFTIQVRVLSSTPPGNITNTASVSAHELDPDTANNTATATTEVRASADLILAKECKPDQPNTQPAGTPTFCDIYVDNAGPSDALNVVITDQIISSTPITITAVTSSTTSGAAAVCLPATPIGPTTTTTITCTDAVLPAGARDTIRVTFVANSGGDVDDTATVTSATADPNPNNNSAVGRVSFRSAVDLSLVKADAPDPVTAGTNLTYTLSVANAGPSTAVNVVVHDALSGQVSFVSATPSQGSCQAGVVPGDPTKPLTCNLGTLASGGSATLTVVVNVNSDVPPGTILVNNADVTSDSPDSNTSNNVATASTTVQTRADLAILKTSDSAVYKPSTVVTYSINVMNNGPSKALNVVVTDNLPELKAAIYQSDTGGCVRSTPTTLTCNLGDMAVGQSKTFFIYVLVKGSRGEVSNTASVASATTDPVSPNNSSTRVVTIGK